VALNTSLVFAGLDDDVISYQRLGFADAAKRRPFTAEYERMTNMQQRNYEIGRMMAALARPGLKDKRRNPEWPMGERGGAMLRRYLGEEAGRQAVIELNIFIARDTFR
jgi:hypothetical protein